MSCTPAQRQLLTYASDTNKQWRDCTRRVAVNVADGILKPELWEDTLFRAYRFSTDKTQVAMR